MFENLNDLFKELDGGNNLGEKITLVGASKTMPVETINQAIALGLSVVAENKVQEFREKHEFIDKRASQHFIGHLQTNKVKYLVGKVELIHSVDSLHLAAEIDKAAKKLNLSQEILLEVNIGGELSKSGFNPSNVIQSAMQMVEQFTNVKIVGLMAMLPHSDDAELLSGLCKKMREIYDQLKNDSLPFKYLSVGMSNDYKIAIKNGSNMIRLGRTIFGERNYGGNNGII